jgi:RNA polymerase sigma-70 factor (ECF subfamily)
MDQRAAPVPDADLVARIALGDEMALAEIYDRHAEAVFGAAVRLLGDRAAAEEIVQETWLVLWNRAERYDPRIGSLVAWLFTIARNRCVDRLRAAGRRPSLVSIGAPGEDADEEALERALAAGEPVGGAGPDADPADAVARRWTRSVVRAVVATLPDTERAVIELAYDEGLSQSEVSARLGWPLGTVKTRTRRALLRLREALGDTLAESAGGVDGSR